MLPGVCSSIGKVRESNEDAYFVGTDILVVADGMGGHNAGEIASSTAIRTFVEALGDASGLPDRLVDAFQEANSAVFSESQDPEKVGMGTTLTCAVLRNGSVYIGHVGDSRAYMVRDGAITPLSVDHSVVGELVRSGNLSPEEAKVHPHRHFLTRALGTGPSVQVDVQVRSLEPGDVLVLCTDGLTGVVSESEIVDALSGSDPQEAADSLVALANSRGGPDNVTVLIGKLVP